MSEPVLRPDPRVSIVIPVLDEEAVLPLLMPRLRAVMDALPGGAEAWFVDDGSQDATAHLIVQAHGEHPRTKLCSFRGISAPGPPSPPGWTAPRATPSF